MSDKKKKIIFSINFCHNQEEIIFLNTRNNIWPWLSSNFSKCEPLKRIEKCYAFSFFFNIEMNCAILILCMLYLKHTSLGHNCLWFYYSPISQILCTWWILLPLNQQRPPLKPISIHSFSQLCLNKQLYATWWNSSSVVMHLLPTSSTFKIKMYQNANSICIS